MDRVAPHPMAGVLQQAGYHVTSRGGWITAAGHGALHRFHGWAQVPWASAWRASLAVRPPGWACALQTSLGDRAWQAVGYGAGLEGLAAGPTAAGAFEVPALVLVCDDARVVEQAAARRASLIALAVSVALGRLSEDDPAVAAVRALPPRPATAFDPARIAGSGPQRVAHGTHDYGLDLRRGTCSCPAFRYGTRPSKHLRAARSGTALRTRQRNRKGEQGWPRPG